VAGARDYFVGSEPAGASYQAPLVGQQLGEALASLPEEYFKGTQRKRALSLQRAFPNGLPTNPDGSLDLRAAQDTMAKLGGAEYASPIINQQFGLQVGQQMAANLRDLDRGGPGSSSGNPGYNGQAAGPGNLQPRQPRLSSAGTDNAGADNLASLASETGVDLGSFLPKVAARMGVSVDQPLSAEQASVARATLSNAAQLYRGQRGTVPGSSETNQPAAATSAAEINGNAARPNVASGASGAPGATPTGAPETTAPASGIRPQGYYGAPAGPQTYGPAAAGLVPPGADPRAFADQRRSRAVQARTMALQIAPFNAASASQLEKQADAWDAQAKTIDEAIAKDRERTPAQKEADQEGRTVTQQRLVEEQQKYDVTHYGKQLAAIQGAAGAANRMLHYTQLAKGIYRDPNVYFGTGESWNLAWKKIQHAFDPNNTESLGQEAYRKVTASSVLAQVEQLKDDTAAIGGGGRIFQQQVELMEKAAGSPDNTAPALRLLTEIAERSAKMSKHVAAMANRYKGGHLDANFAQMVDDYFTKNPMFTDAEMRDIRLIAPPEFSKDQGALWSRLPPGTPIKVDGQWFKTSGAQPAAPPRPGAAQL
jgi:hypothetical protein